jgi:uncharacterized membrane protein
VTAKNIIRAWKDVGYRNSLSENDRANDQRRLRVWETVGWAVIVLLSAVGVAGSVAHLLDGVIRVGDVQGYRETTEKLYGSDFTPHWYNYRNSPLVRAAHMAPGLIFMACAPLQLVGSIRRRMPRFHRWLGRIVISMTIILIPSGIAFAALHPFSGAFEELVPIGFYTVIYLVAVTLGVKSARARDFVAHREWMIRAFSIGIGISSVRLWYVLFLHTTGMHAQRFFATAFWIAFGVNLLIAEIWINLTRSTAHACPQPSPRRVGATL